MVAVDDEYFDASYTKREEKLRLVKRLVKDLGFINENEQLKHSKDEFTKLRTDVMTKNEIFTQIDYASKLFEFKKKNINSNRAFIGFIKTLLDDYGFEIKTTKKCKRLKNLNKRINDSFYHCNIISFFGNFVDNKKKNILKTNILNNLKS